MTTPHEIKIRLEQRLQELQATVTDIHSIVMEGDTVYVGFDATDATGDLTLLFYDFELPAVVSRADIREFCGWIAQTGRRDETLH